MYHVQPKPTKAILLDNGSDAIPLITLTDAAGGVAHICQDDGCFVLYLKKPGSMRHKLVSHWFPEATKALSDYLGSAPSVGAQESPTGDGPALCAGGMYHDRQIEGVGLHWDDIPEGCDFALSDTLALQTMAPLGQVYTKISRYGHYKIFGEEFTGLCPYPFFGKSGFILLAPAAVEEEDNDDFLSTQQRCDLIASFLDHYLRRLPTIASSDCGSLLHVEAMGEGRQELLEDINAKIIEATGSGIPEAIYQDVKVHVNVNAKAPTWHAQAKFLVRPEVLIHCREQPWIELTGHQTNSVNKDIYIARLDAPGHGGACHDYVVLAGIPEKFEAAEVLRDINNRSYPLYDNGRVKLYALRYSEEEVTRYVLIGWSRDGQEVSQMLPASHASLIRFQNGPIKENGINGLTNEALMTILQDRLRGFQSGPFSCRENAVALTKLDESLMWLHHRTASRQQRGVEGKSVV